MKSVDYLIKLFTDYFPNNIDLTEEDYASNQAYLEWFWDNYDEIDQRLLLRDFWEDFAEDIYNKQKNGK